MKTRLLIITAGMILGSSIFFVVDDVFALCMPDSDWPDKPCYGCPSCYPGIEQEKKDWQGYLDYKGELWMNQKKNEMLKVIEQESLEQWLDHKSSHYTNSNYNVWKYNYLNGEVPRDHGKYVDEFDPPRYQFGERYPQSYVSVLCNNEMKLLFKENTKTPACVTAKSADVLTERGWGNHVKTKNIDDDMQGSIRYDIEGGELSKITPALVIQNSIARAELVSLTFHIVPTTNGTLAVSIPYDILNTHPDYWRDFVVAVDGNEIETINHNKRESFQTHIVPFESGTQEIIVSKPDKSFWITVEKVNSTVSANIEPELVLSDDDLSLFPDLDRKIHSAAEFDGPSYTTPSPDETLRLVEMFNVSQFKQNYIQYEKNLFHITLSFQYGHPSDLENED